MATPFRKTALAASTAMSLSFVAFSAEAFPTLPVGSNLNFTNLLGTGPKSGFTSANPAGWTGGSGLIFIASPTPGHSAATGGYLTTYGDPVGNIPGNYVEADGNPTFESGFQRQLTGLVSGQTYTLSFYQGASTQTGFGFNNWTGTNTGTTNQWVVSLGKSGMSIGGAGPVDPQFGPTLTYFNADPNASVATSQVMTVPFQGTVGWQFVSVNLTADGTTDLLSFLAWGDNGSTVNLPPIAFLAGVNAPPGLVPEPATMAMFGVGLAGLGVVVRRRRKSSASN